ncbi:hypothetical protein [Parafrankia sp. FMc2]|uniref:hypothetical protein n=1 Tax=Parafrankia sp. FMc2 TaxID=3233196 RepID=UPI0034D4A9AC
MLGAAEGAGAAGAGRQDPRDPHRPGRAHRRVAAELASYFGELKNLTEEEQALIMGGNLARLIAV